MKSHAEITETLKQHYEATLAQHGDSEKGHDWGEGTERARFETMMGLLWLRGVLGNTTERTSVLDYGCGTGRLYDYMQSKHPHIKYHGYDASGKMIRHCVDKFGDDSADWHLTDVLQIPDFTVDYTIVNGIFTQKLDIDYYEFAEYWQATIKALWKITRRGIAVNFMSNVVDERRENLYHLAQDAVLWFAWKQLGTRNVVFRNDYGLFEYTAYIYK